MNILKIKIIMKHFLIGLLFVGLSAFTPTLPASSYQYEQPELQTLPAVLQLPEVMEVKTLEGLPEKAVDKTPLPEWKVIVDDVVVMLHDKSEQDAGLAMNNYVEARSKYPFPG